MPMNARHVVVPFQQTVSTTYGSHHINTRLLADVVVTMSTHDNYHFCISNESEYKHGNYYHMW